MPRCSVIRFDAVTKSYLRGSRPALDEVSLDIARGDFVFLVGPSGSGKSTLMSLILREELATGGTVFVGGRNVARIPAWKVPAYRQGIGMVFQDFRLLPNRTAYENIAFALQVIGRPAKTIRMIVPEVMEMVGLEDKDKRFPHELSGGEQQRIAIARATVNRPPILMADEPTGNLDPATSQGIMAILERINESGTTVIMATHDYDLVDTARRRVVELSAGEIVRDEASGTYSSGAAESEIYDPLRDLSLPESAEHVEIGEVPAPRDLDVEDLDAAGGRDL